MRVGDIIIFVVTIATLGIAYGFAYFVYQSAKDNTARLVLNLLFAFIAAVLIAVGIVLVAYGIDGGWVALVSGVGLGLPLASLIRRLFARVTPMDPDSPVDMAGLCVVLAVIGVLITSYILSPGPADTGSNVRFSELLVQFLAEVAFAYVLVGFGIIRNFREASARLGLVKPTAQLVGVAVGLVIVAYIVVVAGGVATSILQPDVSKEIEKITKEITSDVQNPIGAAFFGLGAGAGEEMLLRGAIQPRFGLLTTSVLFALLHNQYGISFVLLGIFIVGVMLGLERKYLGTTASIITHAIFNTIAVLV